ncbi:MAG: hypothetical protein CMM54_00560 [Rhodospirillaceae bacterium]|nr:hypothetical protein [Rhodospirillaceae bacterium]|tara:strand:+ start:1629 stop:2039 length:411 start_codon:yes stop_codon:yes gene_type:complete
MPAKTRRITTGLYEYQTKGGPFRIQRGPREYAGKQQDGSPGKHVHSWTIVSSPHGFVEESLGIKEWSKIEVIQSIDRMVDSLDAVAMAYFKEKRALTAMQQRQSKKIQELLGFIEELLNAIADGAYDIDGRDDSYT